MRSVGTVPPALALGRLSRFRPRSRPSGGGIAVAHVEHPQIDIARSLTRLPGPPHVKRCRRRGQRDRPPFGGVAVQETLVAPTVEHCSQLPRQVVGIGHRGTDSGRAGGGHPVRRVPDEEDRRAGEPVGGLRGGGPEAIGQHLEGKIIQAERGPDDGGRSRGKIGSVGHHDDPAVIGVGAQQHPRRVDQLDQGGWGFVEPVGSGRRGR